MMTRSIGHRRFFFFGTMAAVENETVALWAGFDEEIRVKIPQSRTKDHLALDDPLRTRLIRASHGDTDNGFRMSGRCVSIWQSVDDKVGGDARTCDSAPTRFHASAA